MHKDNFDFHEWRLYQTNLNLLNEEESDDDWDLGDFGDRWDVTILTVGDTITPDMWKEFNPALQSKQLQIVGIYEDEDVFINDYLGIEGGYVMLNTPDGFTFDFDLEDVNAFLKPQYKIVPPENLNESEEDDWDLGDYGDRWNAAMLTVGDIITPEMWNKELIFKHFTNISSQNYLLDIFSEPRKISYIDSISNKIYWFLEDTGDIDWYNWWLKPQYRVVPPEDLNESEEDEWDLGDYGDRWDVKILTIGDNVTPDMWEGPNWDWVTERGPIEIKDIIVEDEFIVLTYNGNDIIYDLNFFNKQLKPQYKIVLPDDLLPGEINESEEDDWDLGDFGDRWDVKELTVGDFITPEMWIDGVFDSSHRKWNLKSHKILNIQEWGDIDRIIVQLEGLDDDYDYVGINWLNNRLKPEYKIVPPEYLNESEDDDWDLGDYGDRWNVTMLTVGDTITPDMWKEKVFTRYNHQWYKMDHIISDIWKWEGDDLMIEFDNNRNEVTTKETLHHGLKSQYKVVEPENLNESEEDDWDLGDYGDRWNVKELGAGDVISGDMWDQEKITNRINDKYRYNPIIADEITEFWKQVYDKGITIKSIEITEDYPWILTNPGDLIDWGPGVEYINKLLKPQYRIISPEGLNESEEEDEWDLGDYGDRWDVKELTIGDTITPDMWKEKVFTQYNHQWYKRNHIISDIWEWGEGTMIEFDNHRDWVTSEKTVKHDLKPQYRVVKPEDLLESEEDDWDLGDYGDRWNAAMLTVGDTITPDMWDKEKFDNPNGFIITNPDWFLVPHKITDYKKTFTDFVVFDNDVKRLSASFVKNFLKNNIVLDL